MNGHRRHCVSVMWQELLDYAISWQSGLDDLNASTDDGALETAELCSDDQAASKPADEGLPEEKPGSATPESCAAEDTAAAGGSAGIGVVIDAAHSLDAGDGWSPCVLPLEASAHKGSVHQT